MNINEYIQSFINNENGNIGSRIIKQQPLNENLKVENSYLCNLLGNLRLQNLEGTEFNALKLHVSSTQKNSSKSDFSYVTANSTAGSSYFTVAEEDKQLTALVDLKNSNRCKSGFQSEISFDSSIDKGKRELIIRLLQSKASDSDSEEEACTQCSCENDQWDDDIDEQLIYKDKLHRFLQSIEEQNLHDYSKEDCEKDSEDERRPVQIAKEFSIKENTREYFMNISDEDFSIFERNETLEEIISRNNQKYL